MERSWVARTGIPAALVAVGLGGCTNAERPKEVNTVDSAPATKQKIEKDIQGRRAEVDEALRRSLEGSKTGNDFIDAPYLDAEPKFRPGDPASRTKPGIGQGREGKPRFRPGDSYPTPFFDPEKMTSLEDWVGKFVREEKWNVLLEKDGSFYWMPKSEYETRKRIVQLENPPK